MKVGPSVKKVCDKCKIVVRHRRNGKRVVMVVCKSNPRHKKRQP